MNDNFHRIFLHKASLLIPAEFAETKTAAGRRRMWRTHRKLAPGSPRLLRFPPMPATFEDAFERVKQLAADFQANEKFYLSPAYQEAEARRDFIDKFLFALGWDVNHDRQKNPYEQEVKVERKEHGVSQCRADYAFYLAPNFRDVKFYLEAKKPFGDIATPDNYFQTIRYGWGSERLPPILSACYAPAWPLAMPALTK